MTTLLSLLADRAAASATQPFFEIAVSTPALQWLGTPEPGELPSDAADELTRLDFVSAGELTSAGRFARDVTTRDDREMLLIRAQRGDSIRSLECFIDGDLILAIDDSAGDGMHHLGYLATTDIANTISRWMGILPHDVAPEADATDTLDHVLERAASVDGDVTLYSVATEDALMLTVVNVAETGYFLLETDLDETQTDPAEVAATLTSVSGYNVYLMLVDVLLTPPSTT